MKYIIAIWIILGFGSAFMDIKYKQIGYTGEENSDSLAYSIVLNIVGGPSGLAACVGDYMDRTAD